MIKVRLTRAQKLVNGYRIKHGRYLSLYSNYLVMTNHSAHGHTGLNNAIYNNKTQTKSHFNLPCPCINENASRRTMADFIKNVLFRSEAVVKRKPKQLAH